MRKNGISGATAIVTPLIFNVLCNPTLWNGVFSPEELGDVTKNNATRLGGVVVLVVRFSAG